MSARFAVLMTVALIAAAPALAQDPRDNLPPRPMMWDRQEGPPAPHRMHPPMHERTMGSYPDDGPAWPFPYEQMRPGYTPEQRGAWLDACRAAPHGPQPDFCDAYLDDYERALVGPAPRPRRGPFRGGPMAAGPAYVTPGYVVPPLMWVRVPIVRQPAACDCGQVIEEDIMARPVSRARRVIERRIVRDKAVRATK